jgi:hypothetical protein
MNMAKTQEIKNVLAEQAKQPRQTFFMGASVALGWDLGYDDLYTLATHTRTLAECIDVLDVMRKSTAERRVGAGLQLVATWRGKEEFAARVLGKKS